MKLIIITVVIVLLLSQNYIAQNINYNNIDNNNHIDQTIKNSSCNVNIYLQQNDTRPILSATSTLSAIATNLVLNQSILRRSSFLYNLIAIASENDDINSKCLKEMNEIRYGIDEHKIWAMRGI